MEIYISTDIESDGPIPGPNSMLSFGSAAYVVTPYVASTSDPTGGCKKVLIGTFSRNLEILPGATGDSDTMDFWAKNPEAWAACRVDPVPAREAMEDYVKWVQEICGPGDKPVFVAYPAGFDFLFMYWYMIKFTGKSPFSFSALDVKSYAMAMLGTGYRESTKKNFPKRWFDDLPHNHVALDDAIEQGAMFCNMLIENKKKAGK